MKYFTKYLPVEGEIKKNSYITWWIGDKHGDVVIASEDGKWPEKYKITKLFLCSRDIQIGDKFYIYGVEFPTTYGGQKLTKAIEEGQVFKVIGEVSPEAIWVKEGDEFKLTDFNPLSAANIEHNKPITVPIKIKCSQCSAFH